MNQNKRENSVIQFKSLYLSKLKEALEKYSENKMKL